jgi:hypothetical protein
MTEAERRHSKKALITPNSFGVPKTVPQSGIGNMAPMRLICGFIKSLFRRACTRQIYLQIYLFEENSATLWREGFARALEGTSSIIFRS